MLSPLLATVLLGTQPGTCSGFPDTAALHTLVPADATMMVGADVDGIAATPFWNEIEPALRADLGIGQGLQVADKCGLALDRIYELVAARNAGDERLIVARGNDIGRPERIRCVESQLRARMDGRPPWVSDDGACAQTLTLTGTGTKTVVFVVNRYTLVVAQGDWIDAVDRRLVGTDPMGVPRVLQSAVEEVDRKRSLWLTSVIAADERRQWPGGWAQEVDAVAVDVQLDTGAQLEVHLHPVDAAGAVTTRELLVAAIVRLGRRVAAHGATLRLSQDPTVAIEDGWVTASLAVSRTELLRLRDGLGSALRGRGLL